MYDIVCITNKYESNCRMKVLKHTFIHPCVVSIVGDGIVVAAFGTIAFILISIIYMLVCHSGELLLFLEREKNMLSLFCPLLLFVLLFTVSWASSYKALKKQQWKISIHFLVELCIHFFFAKIISYHTMNFDDHVFA